MSIKTSHLTFLNHSGGRALIALALALSLLVCPRHGLSQSRSASTPTETVTLQLKWKHQFQFAGYYAAIEKGYYRAAGIDVVLREADNDIEPAEAMLRHGAEYGIATSDLLLLRSKGRPVVALAPIFQHSPLIFLTAGADTVSSVHDLKGKSVMIEPHAAELLAYLEYEGVSLKDVTIVPHAFDPSPLINGSISAMSAYSTDEPFMLTSREIAYMTFTPRAGGIDFYGDTLFTTEDHLRRRPEQVKRFIAATQKGWIYALNHQEEIVDLILNKYSRRHTREHLLFEAEMTERLILPDVVEVGYSNPGRWRHIADTYIRMGMAPPDVSLEGFLYIENQKTDLSRFYIALSAATLVITILMIVAARFFRMNRKIRKQARSLEKALGEIKVLRGIIPICMHCKKIRDDQGFWNQVENYISTHTDALFSHGICSDCVTERYPEFKDEIDEQKSEKP